MMHICTRYSLQTSDLVRAYNSESPTWFPYGFLSLSREQKIKGWECLLAGAARLVTAFP
jgi:hypothetical protein